MALKIALAGNPNSGKTTLFNLLTGSNQFVGNWAGVTVEKKEGVLKNQTGVAVIDLPGIYSLSPYSTEEVIARNYLTKERPEAVLNIVDGANLERNLYLTTQLKELGIPLVIAVNMTDEVEKNGDKINTEELSRRLGCKAFNVSALKRTGIDESVKAVIDAAAGQAQDSERIFPDVIENALADIEKAALAHIPENMKRWYAVKLFERDEAVISELNIDGRTLDGIERLIRAAESEYEDESRSIIAGERYNYIERLMKDCYKKNTSKAPCVSDKIDRVVTNKWLGLPIFAAVMFIVYYISMVSVGSAATDWANDGVFGDGWRLFGIGSGEYERAAEIYGDSDFIIGAFIAEYAADKLQAVDTEAEDYTVEKAKAALEELIQETPSDASVTYKSIDEETLAERTVSNIKKFDLEQAVDNYLSVGEYKKSCGAPDKADYGVYIPGIPVFTDALLYKLGASELLRSLIIDGITAGVGAVLGFVPQLFVLFMLLAFLEKSGYMARIAFVLDRIFRKFGLSGKSFIPILIGTGCGIPGIMASRTIENESERRLTVMTTTFIPCSAKIPFISLIAGAIFDFSPYVSVSAYFLGMAAIIVSGIVLKRTKLFADKPSAFVMELAPYRLPTPGGILRSAWDRGGSFVKKAGSIILLSTVAVWFLTHFGFTGESLRMLKEDEIGLSLLAKIGGAAAWIFKPLGWGSWQAAVACVTGLIAKENIVSALGVLYGGEGRLYDNISKAFTGIGGYSFLTFNLLCAPCFAAMGAIKREMNSSKWTLFAIGYQCLFAYAVSLIIYQIGSLL